MMLFVMLLKLETQLGLPQVMTYLGNEDPLPRTET